MRAKSATEIAEHIFTIAFEVVYMLPLSQIIYTVCPIYLFPHNISLHLYSSPRPRSSPHLIRPTSENFLHRIPEITPDADVEENVDHRVQQLTDGAKLGRDFAEFFGSVQKTGQQINGQRDAEQ